MNAKKTKKLSPQEAAVFAFLKFAKGRPVSVCQLYRDAKGTTDKQAARVAPRRRQLHVGVLVKRINTKQVKFVIKPATDAPGAYRMTRR